MTQGIAGLSGPCPAGMEMCKKCDAGRCHGPFLFSPKLYLNELEPTALGWMYGLAKHFVSAYSSTGDGAGRGDAG